MTAEMVVQFVATVVFGSLSASVITILWQRKHAREDDRRMLLEKLYKAVMGVETDVQGKLISYASAMRGKITFNEAVDIASKGMSSEHGMSAGKNLRCLIDLYFPNYDSLAKKIFEACRKVTVTTHSYGQSVKRGKAVREDLANELYLIGKELDASCAEMKKLIADEIKRLT